MIAGTDGWNDGWQRWVTSDSLHAVLREVGKELKNKNSDNLLHQMKGYAKTVSQLHSVSCSQPVAGHDQHNWWKKQNSRPCD